MIIYHSGSFFTLKPWMLQTFRSNFEISTLYTSEERIYACLLHISQTEVEVEHFKI